MLRNRPPPYRALGLASFAEGMHANTCIIIDPFLVKKSWCFRIFMLNQELHSMILKRLRRFNEWSFWDSVSSWSIYVLHPSTTYIFQLLNYNILLMWNWSIEEDRDIKYCASSSGFIMRSCRKLVLCFEETQSSDGCWPSLASCSWLFSFAVRPHSLLSVWT